MIIKLLIEAGNMKPGPAVAQKLGPLGINIGKVIQQVNEATENFKGLKVPVELDVNPKTKSFSVQVFSPPVAELIKKELGIEKAAGEHKKLKAGNLAIEEVIKIAKIKFPNMLSKNLKAGIKSVVGSCVSLGVLIENKNGKEIEKEITSGLYDNEINQEKTEASQEKLKQIKEYFAKLRTEEEAIIKKEEEAKAAEDAAKAAAAATAPVAEKKEVAKTTATQEKTEEKKEEKKK